MTIQLRQDLVVKLVAGLQALGHLGPEAAKIASELEAGTYDLAQVSSLLRLPRDLLLRGLANMANMPFADLRTLSPAPEAIAALSEALARKYNVLPLFLNQKELTIGVATPHSWAELDELTRQIPDYEPLFVLIDEEQLERLLDFYYPSAAEAAVQAYLVEAQVGGMEAVGGLRRVGDAPPIISMVDTIIERGRAMGASDIHIEPFYTHAQVRFRVDGRLLEMFRYNVALHTAVVSRFKIISELNILDRVRPQDGRFTIKIGNHTIDGRVSLLRMLAGEKLVVRLMRGEMANTMALEQLGLPVGIDARLRRLLAQPYGMILVTGPTGSGKTSTLYAALQHLNRGERNLVSLEDPIEFPLAGINQVPMRQEFNVTFATALRAVLRQDPDVIMIGEIRDHETAEIAIRGALTGHLLLATLHTNDAVETISRLLEMGVVGGNLAPALLGVVAQRLVRRLCACHTYQPATAAQLASIGLEFLTAGVPLPVPRGCLACKQEGYAGRLVLFELLIADDAVRRLILEGPNSARLAEAARAGGMEPMWTAGLREVLAGNTSLDEILRVVSHTG